MTLMLSIVSSPTTDLALDLWELGVAIVVALLLHRVNRNRTDPGEGMRRLPHREVTHLEEGSPELSCQA
jgi:hypothetical protein